MEICFSFSFNSPFFILLFDAKTLLNFMDTEFSHFLENALYLAFHVFRQHQQYGEDDNTTHAQRKRKKNFIHNEK
jgi:hypothetical protein